MVVSLAHRQQPHCCQVVNVPLAGDKAEVEMKYFVASHGEHQELVVVKAKSMFVARALLNDDCEHLKRITAKEAKQLIARGFTVKT